MVSEQFSNNEPVPADGGVWRDAAEAATPANERSKWTRIDSGLAFRGRMDWPALERRDRLTAYDGGRTTRLQITNRNAAGAVQFDVYHLTETEQVGTDPDTGEPIIGPRLLERVEVPVHLPLTGEYEIKATHLANVRISGGRTTTEYDAVVRMFLRPWYEAVSP